MIIGISGKSGSGKSTLANKLINEFNGKAIHLDIDKVGHNVLKIEEVKKELISSYGSDIITNKDVDRKKLGDIVFNSRNEMKKLTHITWKYMEIEIDNFINNNKNKIIILDWILLPNTKYFNMCDIKILLLVPYKVRRQRALLRDNITAYAFDTREKASINYKLEDFDYILKSITEENIRKLVMIHDKSLIHR